MSPPSLKPTDDATSNNVKEDDHTYSTAKRQRVCSTDQPTDNSDNHDQFEEYVDDFEDPWESDSEFVDDTVNDPDYDPVNSSKNDNNVTKPKENLNCKNKNCLPDKHSDVNSEGSATTSSNKSAMALTLDDLDSENADHISDMDCHVASKNGQGSEMESQEGFDAKVDAVCELLYRPLPTLRNRSTFKTFLKAQIRKAERLKKSPPYKQCKKT